MGNSLKICEFWPLWSDRVKDDPEYCLLKIAAAKALYRDLEQHGFVPQPLL